MNKYYNEKDIKGLTVPDVSMYEYLRDNVIEYKDLKAMNYFNKYYSFKNMLDYVEMCAKSLKTLGINKGDVVTICMPNTPESIIALLAINKIGAIADLIHPLSSEVEIKNYINDDNSKLLIAINVCYSKIKNIKDDICVNDIVIVNASDSMPLLLNVGYNITEKRKTIKKDNFYIYWKDFLMMGRDYAGDTFTHMGSEDIACILHSGGTTSKPKSILLSNRSFTIISKQGKLAFPNLVPGDNILCILPLFHCFGLIVCAYAPLTYGMTSILIPQFDARKIDKLLKKHQPNVMAGVPTLFEAMMQNKGMNNVDLSCLKYVISGGDTLGVKKNREFNEFLHEHGATINACQGYGMTETSGPITFAALGSDKLGSCGTFMPGNEIVIRDLKNDKILKPGESGEICASSLAVMLGYMNDANATDAATFEYKKKKYIKTGDVGYLDEDGVLFYEGRIKRIIITSGYNVYPGYVEEVMKEQEHIKDCCVIGKPHAYKKEIPVLYCTLKDGVEETNTVKKEIMDYAKKHLAHYMVPKEYIIKDELPKTMIGKVDYKKIVDDKED